MDPTVHLIPIFLQVGEMDTHRANAPLRSGFYSISIFLSLLAERSISTSIRFLPKKQKENLRGGSYKSIVNDVICSVWRAQGCWR